MRFNRKTPKLLGYDQDMFISLTSVTVTHFKVSFYKKYDEGVKQFLTQYCIKRKQEGYMVIKDLCSTFYEALWVGLDGDANLSEGDYMEKTLAPDPDLILSQIIC
ncbi:uncharacterized protein LOC111297265 isoform X3 [Durio zibethinus]|uniref:Uncharacterized protein LOC111297265 isoform X3 n=1 Tax=Durio zibethinus TaxID=66656 RepID=A0A6P5Z4M5_DURZI|nr:uncharacterized protein LOC111297265 isoform X3 [Durio zibethinus]